MQGMKRKLLPKREKETTNTKAIPESLGEMQQN